MAFAANWRGQRYSSGNGAALFLPSFYIGRPTELDSLSHQTGSKLSAWQSLSLKSSERSSKSERRSRESRSSEIDLRASKQAVARPKCTMHFSEPFRTATCS